MEIGNRVTVKSVIDEVVAVFDSVRSQGDVTDKEERLRVRAAIHTLTTLVCGLDPKYPYHLDDLLGILKHHRADVFDALRERGLQYYLSASNHGLVLAEVVHLETGRNMHCSISARYNPDVLEREFSQLRTHLVESMH